MNDDAGSPSSRSTDSTAQHDQHDHVIVAPSLKSMMARRIFSHGLSILYIFFTAGGWRLVDCDGKFKEAFIFIFAMMEFGI